MTSDINPSPCASSGHLHSVGTAWAPRRHHRLPALLLLCHTQVRSPSAQPGWEPVRWAGRGGGSTRGRGALFLHQDLPGERSLNPEQAQKPQLALKPVAAANTPPTWCRTSSPAHTSLGTAANSVFGRRATAGAVAAPRPVPPAHLWQGVGVSSWGRVAAPSLHWVQHLIPPVPAQDPEGDWYPSPESQG